MRSLEHQPDFPNMHFQLAQIRMRKASALLKQAEADLQQAKQAFRSYRGLVPADHEIRIWKADATLADLAVLTGNAAQAAKIYRTILAKQPTLDHVRSKLEKISKPDRS